MVLRNTGNHLVAQAETCTRKLMDRMGDFPIRAVVAYQQATEGRAHALAHRLNTLVIAQLTGATAGTCGFHWSG